MSHLQLARERERERERGGAGRGGGGRGRGKVVEYPPRMLEGGEAASQNVGRGWSSLGWSGLGKRDEKKRKKRWRQSNVSSSQGEGENQKLREITGEEGGGRCGEIYPPHLSFPRGDQI